MKCSICHTEGHRSNNKKFHPALNTHDISICNAITKSGSQCKRLVKHGNVSCTIHNKEKTNTTQVNPIGGMGSWVKIIDLSAELAFDSYGLSRQFLHVANIIRTPEEAKRQTVITFDPVIPQKEWKKTSQWIYIFTINDKIVKIGGTRDGLQKRTGSYLCGHHTTDRGRSGKCSVTNAYLYNTLDYYISQGSVLRMYAHEIPKPTMQVSIWGELADIEPQVYTAYETKALEKYKQSAGHYPVLSDNSDPNHR
jgi:hypothetical protein